MSFRSQIEPSIKSYECFMILQNFRLEITLDWWILKRPSSFFFFKNRERVKIQYIIRHPISSYLIIPPPSFLYTLRTVDHPKRNLKLFCLKSKITFFFLPIYSKIGWCQQVGYYFSVDHNLTSVYHDLPWSPCNFFRTVNHTWPTVNHALRYMQFFSKMFSFFHPIWSMNGRS